MMDYLARRRPHAHLGRHPQRPVRGPHPAPHRAARRRAGRGGQAAAGGAGRRLADVLGRQRRLRRLREHRRRVQAGPRRRRLPPQPGRRRPAGRGHQRRRSSSPCGPWARSSRSRGRSRPQLRACGADLAHASPAQHTEPFDERADGDALDGIQVDGDCAVGTGSLARLERALRSPSPAQRRRAGSDERSAQARGIAASRDRHHHGSPTRCPEPRTTTARRRRGAVVTSRRPRRETSWRSPHSSGSSSGCSS